MVQPCVLESAGEREREREREREGGSSFSDGGSGLSSSFLPFVPPGQCVSHVLAATKGEKGLACTVQRRGTDCRREWALL